MITSLGNPTIENGRASMINPEPLVPEDIGAMRALIA
jgi:hypothetical protein